MTSRNLRNLREAWAIADVISLIFWKIVPSREIAPAVCEVAACWRGDQFTLYKLQVQAFFSSWITEFCMNNAMLGKLLNVFKNSNNH